MKTHFTFYIRNYWKGYFDRHGLIWIGYTWQGYDLICWEITLLGFGFCLFEHSKNVSIRRIRNLFKGK
jgi:hypothetical protein